MELKNSTILITGGSSGIGLELVRQLTQQGAKIIRKLSGNKPELKPALVGVIKFAGRLVPGLLMKIGHREFKKFRTIKK